MNWVKDLAGGLAAAVFIIAVLCAVSSIATVDEQCVEKYDRSHNPVVICDK